MADLKWYVVRAVSGQEKKSKQYLETEIARQNFGEWVPQILIPAEKVFEMRNGKKRVRERSFFPGYILIEADLSHGELEHTILSTPGVIGFLGSDEGKDRNRKPVPLRLVEVNRILGKLDENDAEDASLAVPFGHRARDLRRAQAPQRGGEHLRPRNARRAQLHAGREGYGGGGRQARRQETELLARSTIVFSIAG